MTLIRLIAALLAAAAMTVTVLGFAVTQSLSQSQQFVTAMEDAIAQPAVQAEVAGAMKQQILAAGESLAGSAGPLGSLARSGSTAIAGQVDSAVSSPGFADAWAQWSQLLYDGLADSAAGTANADVSVSGSTITVAIGPLVAPIVGETVAGGLTGTLEAVGSATDVTISTALPVQQALQVTGALSQWRWLFAVAAVALALVAIFGGPRRMRWAGLTMLLAAGVAAGSSLALQATTSTPPPGSDTPQLSLAVTQALVAPWTEQLRTAAILLGVVGLAAAILGLFVGRPKS